MLLTIQDQTPAGTATDEITLDLLHETLTIRELIRSRVYQEVQDLQRLRSPGPVERTLNAPREAREVDWKDQFEKACAAFERNAFFIVVDGEQLESLDQSITLRHDSRVSFIRLVPLVGG